MYKVHLYRGKANSMLLWQNMFARNNSLRYYNLKYFSLVHPMWNKKNSIKKLSMIVMRKQKAFEFLTVTNKILRVRWVEMGEKKKCHSYVHLNYICIASCPNSTQYTFRYTVYVSKLGIRHKILTYYKLFVVVLLKDKSKFIFWHSNSLILDACALFSSD